MAIYESSRNNRRKLPFRTLVTALALTVAAGCSVGERSQASDDSIDETTEVIVEEPKAQVDKITGWTHEEARQRLGEITSRSLTSDTPVTILAGACMVTDISDETTAVVQQLVIGWKPGSHGETAVTGGILPTRDHAPDGRVVHDVWPITRIVNGTPESEGSYFGFIPGEPVRTVTLPLERADPQVLRSNAEYIGAEDYGFGGLVSLARTIPGSDIPPAHVSLLPDRDQEGIDSLCFVPTEVDNQILEV
jgi:hypothetical protein